MIWLGMKLWVVEAKIKELAEKGLTPAIRVYDKKPNDLPVDQKFTWAAMRYAAQHLGLGEALTKMEP